MKLYCVGVGPGDPKLITIKGKEIIESAEILFAPIKSVHSESFALETVKKVVDIRDKKVVKLIFPMTTKEEKLKPYWEKAYEEIREYVLSWRICVFLVEGDPLIYSTFNSVLEIIKERKEFDVEIIPGISSFQVLAAKLKIPVADGDDVITILPASYKESSGCRTAKLRNDFSKILDFSDTVFVMKSGRVIKDILGVVNGRFVGFFGELCGTENEFLSFLDEKLAERQNHYFSTVMLKKRK